MDGSVLAFGSLFLGLVMGTWPVDLMVSPPVAEVVVVLDGKEVARRREPPWRLNVEFGDALAPHRLEAVGLDARGREVTRIVQRINLPRPAVEVDLVLNRDRQGVTTGATVSWQTSERRRPRAMSAELDGARLPVDPAGVVLFPALAPGEVHFLRVLLDFGDGLTGTRELTFGADVSEVGARALTGVVVETAGGRDPTPASLAGAVLAGGRVVKVAAVEEGPARLAVVFDPRVPRKVWWDINPPERRGLGEPRGEDLVLLVAPSPTVQAIGPGLTSEVFRATAWTGKVLSAFLDGFIGSPEAGDSTRSRLADAVATAGVMAAAEGRRRGVLLVLGAADRGIEVEHTELVRRFLRTLGVPLFVWSPLAEVAQTADGPWGSLTDVSSRLRYARGVKELVKTVERQRVVWIEGDWLPQEVSLGSDAAGLRLAGAPSATDVPPATPAATR